jgi:hypothetical protein
VLRHSPAPRENGRDDPWLSDQTHRGEEPADPDLDEEPGTDWAHTLAGIRRHHVTLACLALILVSLIWKAAFLGHYSYRQDDFAVLDTSLKSHLSWGFLTHVDVGHLFPGVYLIAWLLARAALYNWLAGSVVVLAMLAAGSLAAWRLLRTLLGNRAAIMIPLTFYLLSPLAFATDSWWVTAIEAIPLQIALFMALDSHVRYVRTREFRYAIASAAWQFFGLFFFEKAVVIPVLLFAVTAGFLSKWRLLAGLRATIVGLWKGWLLYLGLLVAYGATALLATQSSGTQIAPSSAQSVYSYTTNLVLHDLLPGLLGGPWQWYNPANSPTAYSWPPQSMVWLSLFAVLAVVGASILVRRRAARAWAILAGWVVLADIVPVVVGRLGTWSSFAGIFGITTRYVTDAPAVVAIVVALAFWPVSGPEQDPAGIRSRRREFFTGQWKTVAIGLVAVFVVGSVWSVQRYQTLTSTGMTVISNQAYIANARAALAQVPAGTVIVSQPVPTTVMWDTFGEASSTSVVLGPLSPRRSQISWTSLPVGTIGPLRVFGTDGRLWPVAIIGSTTTANLTWPRSCLNSMRQELVLPFQPASTIYAYVLRLGYTAAPSAAGQVVTVTYGRFTSQFTVRPGLHNVYLAVSGSAPNVVLQAQSLNAGPCFGQAVAGTVGAYPSSPIPSTTQN